MKKWYYNSWILAAFFIIGAAGSVFIFGIPVLLVALFFTYKKTIYEKSIEKKAIESETLKTSVETLNSKVTDLTEQNTRFESMLTPEMQKIENQYAELKKLELKKASIEDSISALKDKKITQEKEITTLQTQVKSLKDEIINLDDEILYQSFGIYTPVYNLMSSELYKDRITSNRYRQKQLIKQDEAATYTKTMTLDGDLKKGQKMVKDNVKQILRSFNNECDAAISGVKFNNIVAIEKRIQKSRDTLEKLNKEMNIKIQDEYFDLKIEELRLCHEYAIKKQEEKEDARAKREALREEAKLQREMEEARKNIIKEQNHYKSALQSLESQLVASPDDPDLLAKKEELLNQLDEIDTSIKDLDYREANKRAGYVYIISNIGSFGKDVYKIGMTRRLDPMDRVNELGDASVPFNFDLHAMIFSDDAPGLENALHKEFEQKKVNMINPRREFFNVTLEEIEATVKRNFDKTVEFSHTPEAEQYRETQMILKELV